VAEICVVGLPLNKVHVQEKEEGRNRKETEKKKAGRQEGRKAGNWSGLEQYDFESEQKPPSVRSFKSIWVDLESCLCSVVRHQLPQGF